MLVLCPGHIKFYEAGFLVLHIPRKQVNVLLFSIWERQVLKSLYFGKQS